MPAYACINRNILECKDRKFEFFSSSCSVLIETYWNVKTKAAEQVIDPASINRNILECKVDL